MTKEQEDKIRKILSENYDAGYQDGLAEGFRVAERIAVWHRSDDPKRDAYIDAELMFLKAQLK